MSSKTNEDANKKGIDVERELKELKTKVNTLQKFTFYVFPALFVVLFAILYVPQSPSVPISSHCRGVYVYHWEKLVDLETTGFKHSPNCEIPLSTLIHYTNKAFKTNSIIDLLTETGEDLPGIVDLSLTSGIVTFPHPKNPDSVLLVALSEGEKFFWPAEILNRTVTKNLGPEKNHQVSLKSISKEPRIFELHHLLTPEESDHMYQVALSLEKSESKVGADSKSSVVSKVRTSTHTWMGKENNGTVGRWYIDDIVNLVEDRIFELTRLDQSTSEPFQVVFYDKDQFYYGHHDYTTKGVAPNNPYYQGGGNRLVTVLLYLNDVEEGGETAFPFVDTNGKPLNRMIQPESLYNGNSACESGGVKLKPRKGGAAMFYNLKENGHMDGVVDPFSLHAGCPVLKGEKYITNKWIRNKRVDGKLYDEFW